jgi:hypothetical protein
LVEDDWSTNTEKGQARVQAQEMDPHLLTYKYLLEDQPSSRVQAQESKFLKKIGEIKGEAKSRRNMRREIQCILKEDMGCRRVIN